MPNNLTFPTNNIFHNLENFSISIDTAKIKPFNLSFKIDMIKNNGHSNIDNNGNFFISGRDGYNFSARFKYSSKYLYFEIEPYVFNQNNLFNEENSISQSYQHLNNHHILKNSGSDFGFKNSQLIVHFNGIGLGYGYINHWWSQGFHSAITLSSNAPSQETFSLGTFKDIYFGSLSFSSKVILLPYKGNDNQQLYFSGLRSSLTYHSDPSISIGFNRTYLSAEMIEKDELVNSNLKWGKLDAARLVFEPLFGSSKKGLPYALEGTPGFDPWDEVLSGFINLKFSNDLIIYAEIASDDNRGNFTDLRAHWDHTLGYMLGFKKLFKIQDLNFIIGTEYLSTKESNTLNPSFYRGSPNASNFYSKEMYDFFTYKNRFMGAHSGSSSDDLIFLAGAHYNGTSILFTYNSERHGIKSRWPMELKSEISTIIKKKINNNSFYYCHIEYEKIKNFQFIIKESISRYVWIGYTFSI